MVLVNTSSCLGLAPRTLLRNQTLFESEAGGVRVCHELQKPASFRPVPALPLIRFITVAVAATTVRFPAAAASEETFDLSSSGCANVSRAFTQAAFEAFLR